jgi:CheY-like chemotaxis protein
MYARLTVNDTGRGMDAATVERVFDAFFTTKGVGEGVGLGLSIVHGIMRSHDGAVTVESRPGAGATFALYFPTVAHLALASDAPTGEPGRREASWRVLLVDDEHALVSLATKVLSRMGHEITACTDPREALAVFRSRPDGFDVVVTDLSMPHMSGFELTRELLAIRPEVCVVLTTGHVRAEDQQAVDGIGIRAVVRKPYAFEDLGQVITDLLASAD